MFFGRVVTKSKTLPLLDFVERLEEYSPSDIPTLIIGKKNAEEIFGKENIKVLDKEVSDNVYWTFAKNERRVDFESDMEKFNAMIAHNIAKSVEYHYFNIFTEDFKTSEKFIKWLYEGKKKYVYIKNRHIYIYRPAVNKIYGLSLLDTEYIGKDDDVILEKIKENPNNIIVENADFLGIDIKNRLRNMEYMTPYLYFLKEE